MLKIRRPLGRLIFNMGIAIPGKTVFLIETAPRSRRCACLVTWFCYHLVAKPGNKTAPHSWPDPYERLNSVSDLAIECLSNFGEDTEISRRSSERSCTRCGRQGLGTLRLNKASHIFPMEYLNASDDKFALLFFHQFYFCDCLPIQLDVNLSC